MTIYCVSYHDMTNKHSVDRTVRNCNSQEEAIAKVKDDENFRWSGGLLGGSPIPCWIGGNGVWSAKECDCCYFGHRC